MRELIKSEIRQYLPDLFHKLYVQQMDHLLWISPVSWVNCLPGEQQNKKGLNNNQEPYPGSGGQERKIKHSRET